METPVLLTVRQFVDKHPAFTEGGIRYDIFHEKTNGLAESGAIIRYGRKIIIHESKYLNHVVGGRAAA